MNIYNLYCDESNHLEHSYNKVMTLGYISCKHSEVRNINNKIRSIKLKHNLSPKYEIKWTKVSKGKMDFYEEIIKTFFEDDNLAFRCIIADKKNLNLNKFSLTHDDWYYRIYYLLLGKTLNEEYRYNIYIDIKDTCSMKKVDKLKDVLSKSYFDFTSEMINKVQQIRSHEVELLQLNDLLIGAIGYFNNPNKNSEAKLNVIEIIKKYSNLNLISSTKINDEKFNIFVWEAQ